MSSAGPAILRQDENDAGRREHVLDAALLTFARYGYRKASMEDVARAADISRPGLYLYFASKQDLFRAAVTHALDTDIAAADRLLAETDRPLRDRLIEAFDQWTGRYIGPMTKDVVILIENNPDLLGPISTEYPRRFAKMVTDALAADTSADRAGVAIDVARTLLSTANGIKHEVSTREEFLARMTTATDLLLLAVIAAPGPLVAINPGQWGQSGLPSDTEFARSVASAGRIGTPSKLVMRVRLPSPAALDPRAALPCRDSGRDGRGRHSAAT